MKKQRKIALYIQIKSMLMDRIKNKEWLPGDEIPSERDLMQYYNVSRTTIRQAISALATEGILETRQGAASRVKGIPSEDMNSSGVVHHEQGKLFAIQILRDGFLHEHQFSQYKLDLNKDKGVYFLERLRIADGLPIGIQQLYCPESIGKILQEEAAEWFDVFPILGVHGINYSNIKENVTAVLATQNEADLLGIGCGEPLILIERLTLDEQAKPMEYSKTKYVPAYFKYTIEVGR